MEPINSTFPYHKKFEKVLNDDNRQAVDAAFQRFCSLETRVACKLLWHLTCDEKAIGATLKDMGLDCWPRENVGLLRSELKYQYEKTHKGCFSTKKVMEDWLVAYRALVKHTDPITAKAVMMRCRTTLEMKRRIVKKVIYLLDSEKYDYYCGGLRQMGFSYAEVKYLKDYREYIRALLVAMRAR